MKTYSAVLLRHEIKCFIKKIILFIGNVDDSKVNYSVHRNIKYTTYTVLFTIKYKAVIFDFDGE